MVPGTGPGILSSGDLGCLLDGVLPGIWRNSIPEYLFPQQLSSSLEYSPPSSAKLLGDFCVGSK